MPLRLVVLDAMGVIYTDGDDVRSPLMPFVQARGCGLSYDEIEEHYEPYVVGHCTAREFWKRLGIDVSAHPKIDDEYVRLYKLTPGLREFLVGMQQRKIPVACLSNDAAGWATKRRRLFDLESLIKPWVISGEVGERKPSQEIFYQLLVRTRRNPEDCLFVDDRVSNLDAARELGFQTAHFHPAIEDDPGTHECVESFEELAEVVLAARDRIAPPEGARPIFMELWDKGGKVE